MKKKTKRKKRRSSNTRQDTSTRKDNLTRAEKFLLHVQTIAPNPNMEVPPTCYGSSDWSFRISRGSSETSILFQDGRDPGTVRVFVDHNRLDGHIAFQSMRPPFIGGNLYEVNGHPQAEGNRLFGLFLKSIGEGATVEEVFTKVDRLIEDCGFVGMTLESVDEPSSAEERWEKLERQLYSN